MILRLSLATPILLALMPYPRARACEDDHPPVVASPIEEFVCRDTGRNRIVNLALDPRGVRAVSPLDDYASNWTNPAHPTSAWHYREWQWWKGHPWGDSCRPRYYAEVAFERRQDGRRGATISYQIDGFACKQQFLIPQIVANDSAHWDIITSIRNATGRDVSEYGQFFACYTPLNRDRSFWFWDESDELVLFADRGVGHLNGYVAHPNAWFLDHNAIPNCPRGGGKVVARWRRPLMVSHASPAGWRSIIMIEPKFAAALAQGIDGEAMDYILFPGPLKRRFAKNADFSAHIRHIMFRSPELPTTQRLKELWNEFEDSHAAIREGTLPR